jgi:hypothetical protein
MSSPRNPGPAKLVVGIFLKEKGLIEALAGDLIAAFGPVDVISPWFSFDYTTYYRHEMGAPLFRRMFAFSRLIKQNVLAQTKVATNTLELKYTKEGKRRINIDPGYMLPSRFVLATGKDFAHRIYIGQGIYADLAFIYQKKDFQKLPWTYPDYADSKMITYLKRVRSKFVHDLKRNLPS